MEAEWPITAPRAAKAVGPVPPAAGASLARVQRSAA